MAVGQCLVTQAESLKDKNIIQVQIPEFNLANQDQYQYLAQLDFTFRQLLETNKLLNLDQLAIFQPIPESNQNTDTTDIEVSVFLQQLIKSMSEFSTGE